jgi:hypothetical protein
VRFQSNKKGMNEKQGSVITRAVVGKRGIQMVVIFGIQEATLESEESL